MSTKRQSGFLWFYGKNGQFGWFWVSVVRSASSLRERLLFSEFWSGGHGDSRCGWTEAIHLRSQAISDWLCGSLFSGEAGKDRPWNRFFSLDSVSAVMFLRHPTLLPFFLLHSRSDSQVKIGYHRRTLVFSFYAFSRV